jgi:DNA-binding Lrp family transcriptional regulator
MERDAELLELLEADSRLSHKQLADMLGMQEDQVAERIRILEEEGAILCYRTVVNWEKVGREKVYAFIKVKVMPQRDVGFDAVAERIYRFPEVNSVYLVSGDYDLAVLVEGESMKEVAHFVATKLSTIEGVVSTSTHFVLKAYKQEGVILEDTEKNKRLVVTP